MRWPWSRINASVDPDQRRSGIAQGCLNCGWLDQVIMRPIYRFTMVEGEIHQFTVGAVVRCARCVHEQIIGPGGVYEPRPSTPPPPPPMEQQKRTAVQPGSRYSDQPWDKG